MAYTKEKAHEQFRKWSDSYDRSILQKIFFAPAHRLLLHHLDRAHSAGVTNEKLQILDVGCGTGTLAQRLVQREFRGRFCGLDFCQPMLQHAVARDLPAYYFSWIRADSQRLPFAAHSFDAVTCVHSFHHYPHQKEAIHEMFRVLAPGGRAMILDAYKDGLWGKLLYDVCVVALEGGVYHPSAEQFRGWFRDAGFPWVEQYVLSGLAPMLLTIGTVAGDPLEAAQNQYQDDERLAETARMAHSAS